MSSQNQELISAGWQARKAHGAWWYQEPTRLHGWYREKDALYIRRGRDVVDCAFEDDDNHVRPYERD